MMALDTDVLAIPLFYRHDARFPQTEVFLRQSSEVTRGISVYNLLELCGMAKSHGHIVRQLFRDYLALPDVQIFYSPVHLESAKVYWQTHTEALLSRIERGIRLGDAVVLWSVESTGCDTLITWNKRHFEGKTSLLVLTPQKWLARHTAAAT